VVLGARKAERLAAIADDLDPTGERVAHRATDIRNPDDCEALASLAAERFGTIHALVNCAALDWLLGGLEEADLDRWRKVLDTNVMGTMQMTRAALPHLKAQGGAVVFIGSQTTFWPQLLQTAYAASKGALLAASLSLARELGPHRIRVNTVVPTWMWGPNVEAYVDHTAAARGVAREDVIEGLTRGMPLGEVPADEDVAEAVAFFASDRARLVTGQTLFVNAGEYLR
jgi:NAD(P)-dependent dehydrogenase (short-subunit alcohol dehydrogenase family)